MNQVPEATTPSAPAPSISPETARKTKKIIISIIILVAIILGVVIGIKLFKANEVKVRTSKDATIIQVLFDLRTSATNHYEKNKSYKDWWPASLSLISAQELDTTIIYRKPDFQNYIMYAYVPGHAKYFCLDTLGFADEVSAITDDQIKCN